MDWDWVLESDEVVASRRREACDGVPAGWPHWLPAECVGSLQAAGIEQPWQHQVDFAELAHAGRHVAISTPTGSGKSLAYLMPVLAATMSEAALPSGTAARPRFTRARPTALYIAPTKALAHDQLRAATALAPRTWRVGALDGDSDVAERRFAREHASLVVTNPDMLHFSVLPNHQRWSSFLAGLRYIVIDEAHRYNGMFGAHVAAVVRRLRRVAGLYGAAPTMLLSSATAPNAAAFGGALVGEEVVDVVDVSTAPVGPRTVALWQPETSLRHDTSRLLAGLSDDGAQTLAFVASRAGAELVSVGAQELSSDPARIASYRGGYLAMERRALEAALQTGELGGLATTNALELGIDVSGIAAVLVSGYPGRLSAFWQQAGRAGRTGQEALVVMLARENPLDVYLLEHPELIFDAPVEHLVLHPSNPHVLGPHLAAAAQEHPLSPEDVRWFGPTTVDLAEALARQKVLRDRGNRWFWTRADRAVDHIDLRAAGPKPVEIIEQETGRVVGVIDRDAADRTVHPGAVYLHQGQTWLVTSLDQDDGHAFVSATAEPYYTQPQSRFEIDSLSVTRRRVVSGMDLTLGKVRLTSQVTGYLRRDEVTHEVLDASPIDLPAHRMLTDAVWWSVPARLERDLGWAPLEMGAAAHAIEHTAIGLLPAFAPCDRWDIGGVSTPLHPETGLATIFVHDGLPGGAGFAAHAFDVAERWLSATLERLEGCECVSGCPACIVSPKCGNANQVLDKDRAAQLLRALLQDG
ncbi:DEAD/DEAH box helicase [Tessaracoccus antarcticus]|uniref:DEAD/DEAH box helicase n=1 Tax=Tessaracoccus antarcticus TaxID=2479848 RepID=A0A3M0GBF4_9ACTN|nr:DEAD/DEAH box helicase [Tessaracoccus antarcticus]RMB62361.1 DEAD/DEAH box helicase [Tessaracoccus antarcticus]